MTRPTLVLLFALALGGAGAPAAAQEGSMDARLEALLAEDLDALMRAWPVWASVRGDRRFDAQLADESPEAYAARAAADRDRLERLRAISRDALSPTHQTNAALLEWQLSERLAGERFRSWQAPISQINGPQQSLPQLPERLRFTNAAQLEAYVSRLEAIPTLFAQLIANMRAGLAAGNTPPRAVMGQADEQTLAQATEALRADPTQHALYAPFAERDPQDPLARRGRRAILEAVIPAYARLGAFLRDEYVPSCRETIAARDLPEGEAYYAHQLRHYSTTEMSAQAIHDTGLREVARIRAEMFEVIARSDFAPPEGVEGDALFAAFLAYLRRDPRFYCRSADELLRAYRDIAKRVDPELPALFGRLPRNPYGVREMPAAFAPSSPTAYYYHGSIANGVPGWFVANTHALDQRPRYEMIPLTLHEAVPGHHLQISLAQELEGLPEWRSIQSYTAFVEGWALYAERLGLEMGDGPRGLYADPYDDFGRLTYEMWRAMRLVVDTGIHAFGWSRQQAIDYMLANSALSQENIEREVDRYITWPGQAVAYKLGELAIRALRAEAEEALGERFDIRAFHDRLLGQGALPLQLLESRMRAWIAEQRLF